MFKNIFCLFFKKKLILQKIKQPTATIYPELPADDGQNYKLPNYKSSELKQRLLRSTNVQ